MELWSSILVALVLIAMSVWLVRWHIAGWRLLVERRSQVAPVELDYRARQLRRRLQSSVMLGLVGLGMLAGRLLIVWRAPPWMILLFWAGVMLLVVWLALLALVDIIATGYYFARLREGYQLEQARLQAQVRRMERTRGNGRPEGAGEPPESREEEADDEPVG